jgi:hypothetical protein
MRILLTISICILSAHTPMSCQYATNGVISTTELPLIQRESNNKNPSATDGRKLLLSKHNKNLKHDQAVTYSSTRTGITNDATKTSAIYGDHEYVDETANQLMGGGSNSRRPISRLDDDRPSSI